MRRRAYDLLSARLRRMIRLRPRKVAGAFHFFGGALPPSRQGALPPEYLGKLQYQGQAFDFVLASGTLNLFPAAETCGRRSWPC